MMHGVTYNNMTLNNADTFESDWLDGLTRDGIDRPRSFDAVVANPPYLLNGIMKVNLKIHALVNMVN